MTDASTINLSLIFECFMVGNFFFYLGHDIEWYDLGHDTCTNYCNIKYLWDDKKIK